MWLYVLMGIVVVLAALVVFVATRPGQFRVSRSATLPAEARVVFAHINDLHRWEEWSPWAKIDPNAKATYAGPSAGPGASFAWAGNKQVGEGRMTITEAVPDRRVQIELQFFKPFKATNTTQFTFEPEGQQTRVTWTMTGKNNFIGKAMGMLMNCDKMIGGQFEQGLANLKTVVTAEPSATE